MSKETYFNSIEDWQDLITLLCLKQEGLSIGGVLLGKNDKDLSKLVLKCGFECRGLHPYLREGEFTIRSSALEGGFKKLNGRFTFRSSSFEPLSNPEVPTSGCNKTRPEIAYLEYATLARNQELAHKKLRRRHNLHVTATYDLSTQQDSDWADKLVKGVVNFWRKRFQNQTGKLAKQQLTVCLKPALTSILRDFQILQEMGLHPKIQSPKQLWQELASRVGSLGSSHPPYLLVLDKTGLREEVSSSNTDGSSLNQSKDYKSQLANPQLTNSRLANGAKIPFEKPASHTASKIFDHCPQAHRSWVYLPSRKKYVGVLVLEEKPAGFMGDKGQILDYWNTFLSRVEVWGIEIITELTPAELNQARLGLQLQARRAISQDLQASENRTVAVAAQINRERSIDAQAQLYTGDVPLNTAVVILVYRDSIQELDEACRYLSGLVKVPARLLREEQYAWYIWLQTLELRTEGLLTVPYNRRLQFFASEVSGVCNLVQVAQADEKGFEMIADQGGCPIYLDLQKFKNILILATAGGGKSILASCILTECLSLGMSVVIVDFPTADGTGTFSHFTPYLEGVYFDITRQSINLVQPLHIEEIEDEADRQWRVQSHKDDVILILTRLILGSQEGLVAQSIESLIPLILNAFWQDAGIQKRFEEARKDGLGTGAWDNTPTLSDLIPFCTSQYLNLTYSDPNLEQALNQIVLRLNYWLASPLSRTIARPSSFSLSGKTKLITFALTNLQTDAVAEILSLIAFLMARSQTLISKRSALFFDEASVLSRFPSISQLQGRMCATGRKAGSMVIFAAQDVDSIAQSEAGEQILQNISCRLIGRIVPGSATSYQQYLGIAPEIINDNTGFVANRQQAYTKWLLDYNNTYTVCRCYPSFPLLALCANSREEQEARDRFKALSPNKFDWLSEFWRYYKDCLQAGINL